MLGSSSGSVAAMQEPGGDQEATLRPFRVRDGLRSAHECRGAGFALDVLTLQEFLEQPFVRALLVAGVREFCGTCADFARHLVRDLLANFIAAEAGLPDAGNLGHDQVGALALFARQTSERQKVTGFTLQMEYFAEGCWGHRHAELLSAGRTGGFLGRIVDQRLEQRKFGEARSEITVLRCHAHGGGFQADLVGPILANLFENVRRASIWNGSPLASVVALG